MIIKKPYAFLIKNFRIIHGFLFAMVLYLSIKSFNIYTFFSEYVTNHFFVSSDSLASSYINYFMFGSSLLIILVGALIYYLLSLKNKSRKEYMYICIYYSIIFVYFIFMFSVFQKLQYSTIDIETVRAYRDISVMALLPQLVFLFITLGRTLGFNIKQFDFKKDLEGLDIDASDSEEVELTLSSNSYKYARSARKAFRLLKYFILENKFFVIVFSSIIALVVSLTIFMKINVYQATYAQQQSILANSIWYQVNDVYITNTNMSNKVIFDDKYFVLVKVNAKNKLNREITLTRDTFRLKLGDELVIPNFNYSVEFLDIGETFVPITLKPGEEKDLVVVFQVEKSKLAIDYIFRIKNFESGMIGQIDSPYKDVVIKPVTLNSTEDVGTYKIPNDIVLDKTLLKNTKLSIKSYEISNIFREYYKYDFGGVTQTGTYIVKPQSTSSGSKSVLKITGTMEVDSSAGLDRYIKIPSDLYKYYGIIKYSSYGNVKSTYLTPIKVDYYEDEYSYFEVPSDMENANKIQLFLLIRGYRYTINLK